MLLNVSSHPPKPQEVLSCHNERLLANKGTCAAAASTSPEDWVGDNTISLDDPTKISTQKKNTVELLPATNCEFLVRKNMHQIKQKRTERLTWLVQPTAINHPFISKGKFDL